MTDDSSKVDAVPCSTLHQCSTPVLCASVGTCKGRHVLPAKLRAAFDRLESATTPVEVGTECAEFVNMVGDEFGNEAGVRLRDLFATLARQLAEAQREAAELRRADRKRTGEYRIRAEQAESALAAANAELTMLRADAVRNAACPWRVQKGYTSECQPPMRLQDALDQLAAATRRVAEVEGLLRRHISADVDADTTLYAETQAAIDKARATGEGEGNG